MEMKGIDLTKCRNEMATVRFWVQEKKEYTTFGRIETDKGGGSISRVTKMSFVLQPRRRGMRMQYE